MSGEPAAAIGAAAAGPLAQCLSRGHASSGASITRQITQNLRVLPQLRAASRIDGHFPPGGGTEHPVISGSFLERARRTSGGQPVPCCCPASVSGSPLTLPDGIDRSGAAIRRLFRLCRQPPLAVTHVLDLPTSIRRPGAGASTARRAVTDRDTPGGQPPATRASIECGCRPDGRAAVACISRLLPGAADLDLRLPQPDGPLGTAPVSARRHAAPPARVP